jgi:hypothetical protein
LDFRFGFECLFDRFGGDSAIEITPRTSIHGIEIHGVVLFDVDFIHEHIQFIGSEERFGSAVSPVD